MAAELGWDEAESARQLADAYAQLAEFAGPVPHEARAGGAPLQALGAVVVRVAGQRRAAGEATRAG
jgi:hypothetical protein